MHCVDFECYLRAHDPVAEQTEGKAYHIALAKGPQHLEASPEELHERAHEWSDKSRQSGHCRPQDSTHDSDFCSGTLYNCISGEGVVVES